MSSIHFCFSQVSRIIFRKKRYAPHRANLKDDYEKLKAATTQMKKAQKRAEYLQEKMKEEFLQKVCMRVKLIKGVFKAMTCSIDRITSWINSLLEAISRREVILNIWLQTIERHLLNFVLMFLKFKSIISKSCIFRLTIH